MATRPRPTRSRTNAPSTSSTSSSTSAMLPPTIRPRQTVTKPKPTTAEEPHERPNKLNQDAETNIQVVVRCRRRSDREIQDASPIIVQMDGAKSQNITIEAATPISSLGMITLPPTRTYPFDLVFGPEADQALIYNEVVSPMLAEVLQGYNCTLFAYGQTGTGKTCVRPDSDILPRAELYIGIRCRETSRRHQWATLQIKRE